MTTFPPVRPLSVIFPAPLLAPLLFLSTLSSAAQQPGLQPPVPPQSASTGIIELYASTAGPYGESWLVSVVPDPNGDGATLGVEVFSFSPSGNLLGRFDIDGSKYELVLREIQTSRFCELPKFISNPEIPLHQTDLYISADCPQARRRVNLYQPDVMNTPEAARFMRLWNTVFDLLPVGVDWPAPPPHPTTESSLLRCPATVTQNPSQLGLWSHVIQALRLDRPPNQTGGWPTSRVLVVPDRGPEPEWAVTVYLPQLGSAAVEVVALPRNITSEPSEWEEISGEPAPTFRSHPKNELTTIPLDTRRRSLSRDVAETVTATLLQAIETAESSIDEIVIHPTTHYFMAWKVGAGLLCALAESPPPDSLGGRLKALAEHLASFARGEAEEHAVLARLTAVRELLGSVGAPGVRR